MAVGISGWHDCKRLLGSQCPVDILFPGASFRAINEIFGVLYVPLESMGEIEVTGTSYNSIPKCYTYMDMEAAGESGINRLHDHPYLKLRGKGTAVAVIDSGIDYQNEVFRNAGGSISM